MQLHYDADMSLINEEVVMTLNLETKSTESDDPALEPFLEFQESDIEQHSERLQVMNEELVQRLRSLTAKVELNLDEQQWAAFQDALDRPVQSKPRLKKLLNEPGILD
jgi:hypothetical protein